MKVLLNLENVNFLKASHEGKSVGGFEGVLKEFLEEVNSDQLRAREVENLLSQGKIRNFEEALFVIEKADLSLRLLTEIRNKALEIKPLRVIRKL